MTWAVVSKEEMEGFGTSPVFRFYREALGKDNIQLAVIDETDNLDFVSEDDTVLLRTASKSIINTIERKGVKSTAENYSAYVLTSDKKELARVLSSHGINVPRQYGIDEVTDGKSYFVKPCFGSDSKGITTKCICYSKEEVLVQVNRIENELGQKAVIEDFIDGIDCTVACACNYKEFVSSAIDIECEETEGIQTRDCKLGFKEYCSAVYGEKLNEMRMIAQKVFIIFGLKHHARIDFRRDKEGNLFVIDINLLPGLGPLDHFAKCFSLSQRVSYWHVMQYVLNSAK